MLQKKPKQRCGIWSVIEHPWMKVDGDISAISECSKFEDTEELREGPSVCESPTLFKLNNKLSHLTSEDRHSPYSKKHSPTLRYYNGRAA